MVVVGYIRVSTSLQVKEGYSLSYQKNLIREYCQAKGLELRNIYSDNGVSGAEIDRKGLQDMLGALEGVSRIICLATNRLWRDSVFVKAYVLKSLMEANIDIIALDQPTYTIHQNDPEDFLISGIMEVIDEYQRKEIKRKLHRGRKQKAAEGGFCGGRAPLGYYCLPGTKKLHVDPEKAEIVREIFRMKRKRYSLRKIADNLNQKGLTTAEDKPFRAMQVKRVVDRRRFYRGFYRYDGNEVLGVHEALI
jgi:DNA invertase Pin-like site-specific DNA recombinase